MATMRPPRLGPWRTKKAPGSMPGTLSIDPSMPKPVIRVIAYGPDALVEKPVESLDELPGLLAEHPVCWVNVDGLGDAEVLTGLGQIFGLHRLALEDVATLHQRAKAEPYGQQLFIVTRMVFLNERLETEQVSLFLGERFVLTFQERPGDCFEPVRQRLRKGQGRIRQAGPDYLAYALLDAAIDQNFPVLEAMGERLEALENRVMDRPDPSSVSAIYEARRDLLALRRAVWPQREMLSALLREENPLFAPETRLYLRDCYDHISQIIDMVETDRELAGGLLDVYLSSVSNRMNEVMKVLTIIATIFIPLGFIAGLYGMNFDTASPWNLPELGWRYGYPAVLTAMAALAGGMLYYFRRKGWLGGKR